MLNCLSKDSKVQLRLNIKQHRQKLLQYLEDTNDTVLKPKIKLVSNGIEKSNLNYNVKPKIASITTAQAPKILPTIKTASYRNKPTIQVKKYEAVINTKPTNSEVLTDNNINNTIKKYQTRSSTTLNQSSTTLNQSSTTLNQLSTTLNQSSITVNQLPPNIKVNIQDEPLSNFQLKPKPLPNIEIKDPEPEPAIKKLKEQLIEELFDSSSSEESDDNISVGNNDDWNEFYETHSESDVDDNDSSNLRLMKSDGHKLLANDISKEKYMSDSADSDNPVLNTNKRRRTRTGKSQFKIDQPQHRFRTPLDRSLHNAKERACRESMAKKFAILRKCCSYLNSNRRVPSKHSILLAAKKECDLLKRFEKKMLAEKKLLRKTNDILKKRVADFYDSL